MSPEQAISREHQIIPEEARVRLAARNLMKVYRGRKVVREVSIDIKQGEIVGLLGPNGAGKTTTFYMVVGLTQPDGGSVYFGDEEITTLPMYLRARKGISYLPQEPSIFRKLTVEQNLLAILETVDKDPATRTQRKNRLLEEFRLEHVASSYGYALSGGERRRTEIARALVLEPRFNWIELQGLTLGVRRARDGHFYVGSIPVNPAAPDSGFTGWLMRQGRVHVGQATLV